MRRTDHARHAELLSAVQRHNAVIVAEQHVDGRRVQLAATAQGEEIKLTSWTEDARGTWQCSSSMNLPLWALPELAWMLRRGSTDEPAEPLRVGDIVRQRHGGPRMEITGITNAGLAWCVWNVNGETRTAPFELAELIEARALLAP
jgi:uncharacterized protein YodC (DUF2158 family)